MATKGREVLARGGRGRIVGAAVVAVAFGSNGWLHATAMHIHTRVEANNINTAAPSRPPGACRMKGGGLKGNQHERLEDARRSGAKRGSAIQGVWR